MNGLELKPKVIVQGEQSIEKLKSGIRKLSSAVGSTLGPSGNTVLFRTPAGTNVITKDGVSVAEQIMFTDELENMAAELVKEAAKMTNDIAGDGTTTTTILTESIFLEGLKYKGKVPMSEVKKSLDLAVEDITDLLEHNAKTVSIEDIKELESVALISSNGDKMVAELVTKALTKAGKEASITIENAITSESTIDHTNGLHIASPWIAKEFVNMKSSNEIKHDDVYLIISEDHMDDMNTLFSFLAANTDKKFLIVAQSFSEEMLVALVANHMKGVLTAIPIKAPGFGEDRNNQLGDIAQYTNSIVFSRKKGIYLENLQMGLLNKARTVTITDDDTIIHAYANAGTFEDHKLQIQGLMEKEKNSFFKDQYAKRLARLTGGIVVIYIGGNSDVEQKELRDRVQDALGAVESAIEEGIHEGGGIAFLKAIKLLNDTPIVNTQHIIGLEILSEAIKAPFRTIVMNTGKEYPYYEETILRGAKLGYDAKVGDFCNMLNNGIIDPVKVSRVALEKATSIAGTLLTVSNTLIEDTTVK